MMDLPLPDMSGLAVLARIAGMGDCGVIVVSSMADDADRIVGLELDADDDMAQPTGLRELVACIRAVHRRVSGGRVDAGLQASTGSCRSLLTIGPIILNIPHRTVRIIEGRGVSLTPAEFSAVAALANAEGAAVSRDDLSQEALGRPWRP